MELNVVDVSKYVLICIGVLLAVALSVAFLGKKK